MFLVMRAGSIRHWSISGASSWKKTPRDTLHIFSFFRRCSHAGVSMYHFGKTFVALLVRSKLPSCVSLERATQAENADFLVELCFGRTPSAF